MTDHAAHPDAEAEAIQAHDLSEAADDYGGPSLRTSSFLAERIAHLTPKAAAPEIAAPAIAAPGPFSAETPDMAAPELAAAAGLEAMGAEPLLLPASFRLDTVHEYRQRQMSQLAEAPALEAMGAPGQPQAPVPPPANNWIPIGPSVLRQGQAATQPATSGRTPGIAVAPGGTRVYAAAANGGVWRSEDGGRTWASLMNAFDLNPTHAASDSLACGAIALVPGASAAQDRLYVGTGEAHFGSGAMFGVGPVISSDGGENWATEPVAPGSPALAGSGFYALAVDPANSERVVAATPNGVYRREPDGAGGFRWARKSLPGAGDARATSVVVAAAGGVTTFYAARQNGPVYRSTDGHTWTQVGTGFPAGVQRITLAVQAGNASVVYAFTATGLVLRLDVADGAWRQVGGVPAAGQLVGSQGWYDLAMAVAPDNVNRIYLGGSTVWSGGEWSGALYRCEITVLTSPAGGFMGVSATSTYIGSSVHADIHTLAFTPGDADQLWVGCDGGVFFTNNPTGTGNLFQSRNTGLATLAMNHLGQHPAEDAVLFCGTQDNGGERFTGEAAWLYSAGGDCGYFVVNWRDPYRVLNTYTGASIRRSTDGGARYSYSNVNVPVAASEGVLFYAPLVGTPPNPAAPAEADLVAFGSERPWTSSTFGGNWRSIPNNSLSQDRLVGPIRAMAFATANRLYVGTYVGWLFVNGAWVQYTNSAVYRFDRSASGAWTRTRIDTVGGAASLPLDGSVTDIAVDPADASGSSIYITFGGNGDYRHVWHFDGSQWTQRSGPSAGAATSLLDVQHNAIVVDPAHPSHVYVGADIGVWRSTDGGATWQTFSEGLPDAAVIDLALHAPRRLLRAATHGRSVYERTLDALPKAGVELYVRDTQLDQGRFATVDGLPDPTRPGEVVHHWRGPDIKLDTPDAAGQYQFPPGGAIDFLQFVDQLSDDARSVATHATASITTRVYVHVHNRGVTPADGVRVVLLLANASAGLPALPANYWANVQAGTPITSAHWRTVGMVTLDGVAVGAPKVAAFDLDSSLLPPPANLAGNDHHCVLALLHHADDPYTSTETATDRNSVQERKAAHKNLKVVQFMGTLPSPPPLVVPVRIHNARLDREILTGLQVRLAGYPGRVCLYLPGLKLDGEIAQLTDGLKRVDDFAPFEKWAEEHLALVAANQAGERPYDKAWSRQRVADVKAVLAGGGLAFDVTDKQQGSLARIALAPDGCHTAFLLLERPANGRIGDAHTLEMRQLDAEKRLLGGLTLRVELVPEAKLTQQFLRLWTSPWFLSRQLVRARLHDANGVRSAPAAGTEVRLAATTGAGAAQDLGVLRWHSGWRAYYMILDGEEAAAGMELIAHARVSGVQVAEDRARIVR